MEGFDDPGIFFSDNFASESNADRNQSNYQVIKRKFKEFLSEYREEGNFNYKYR